jgi:predicted RNase H-like nuclease
MTTSFHGPEAQQRLIARMVRLKGQSNVRILRLSIQVGLALFASGRHPEVLMRKTITDRQSSVKNAIILALRK